MLKEFKYIYLFRRVGNNQARLILKRKMWNAAKIEKRLHQFFAKSRFRLTKKVFRFKWMQMHIKIGISNNPHKRLRSINRNFYGSGNTEWFAMTLFELIGVYAWILWLAYSWWILVIKLGFVWY
ncbi:MAG: hypothetical protein AAGJ18_25805 [Bacteroidota bacterium]